jgi:lipopolysaccharide/colanic/teichoic acid biosynthesis glycosyltransferase
MSSREKQMASSTLTVANTSAKPTALPPRATHKRDHGWSPVCLPAEQLENTFYFVCKRYLDLILATLLLILLLPLLVVIALLVKLDSPGPVFFQSGTGWSETPVARLQDDLGHPKFHHV